jgi:DNA-nicking Smr family endonuclease
MTDKSCSTTMTKLLESSSERMTRLMGCELSCRDVARAGGIRPGFEALLDIEIRRWLVEHVDVRLLHAAGGEGGGGGGGVSAERGQDTKRKLKRE